MQYMGIVLINGALDLPRTTSTSIHAAIQMWRVAGDCVAGMYLVYIASSL